MTRLISLLPFCLILSEAYPKSYDLRLINGYPFLVNQPNNSSVKVFYLFDLGAAVIVPGRELIDAFEPQHNQDFTIEIEGSLADVKIDTSIASPLRDSVFRSHYLIIDQDKISLELFQAHEQFTSPKGIRKEKIYWSLDQIFINCSLGNGVDGYFHFDSGIPSHSVLEFKTANEARLDSMRKKPRTLNELVEEFIYDESGNPVQKISKVVAEQITPSLLIAGTLRWAVPIWVDSRLKQWIPIWKLTSFPAQNFKTSWDL